MADPMTVTISGESEHSGEYLTKEYTMVKSVRRQGKYVTLSYHEDYEGETQAVFIDGVPNPNIEVEFEIPDWEL